MVINIRANQEMTSDYGRSGRGAVLGEGARMCVGLLPAASWWGRTNKVGPILREARDLLPWELLGQQAGWHAGKPSGEKQRAKQGYFSAQNSILAASWEAAVLVIYGSYRSCWRRALFGTAIFHA